MHIFGQPRSMEIPSSAMNACKHSTMTGSRDLPKKLRQIALTYQAGVLPVGRPTDGVALNLSDQHGYIHTKGCLVQSNKC